MRQAPAAVLSRRHKAAPCLRPLALSISALLFGGAFIDTASAASFPAGINLSSLNGSDGFRFEGLQDFGYAGMSVSNAGDINGDGIDDLIIGASGESPGVGGAGSSYVIFGRSTAFTPILAPSSIDGSNGFRIDGIAIGDVSGISVSAAGDVNADGIDDLIVGAARADPNGSGSGSAYIVFGQTTAFASTLSLSTLNGSNGFRLDGEAGNDSAGRSVSGTGDVNGDGIDDLIIGALLADGGASNAGSSYVVFGQSTPFGATLALSILNGSNGFRLDGEATEDRSGVSVSGAGDINGDGLADLVIGARYADPNGSSSGSSYVVFGQSTAFTPILALSGLNGANGFRLDGVGAGDSLGVSVSAAGDINGDGVDDVIIAARFAGPTAAGNSYVIFGQTAAFASTLVLSTLDGTSGFRLDGAAVGDSAGSAVSAAGDINGDGVDDLIVGANRAGANGPDSGSSFVIFGQSTGFAPTLELSGLNGSNGFRLDGIAAGDYTGGSVSAAGDISGDGVDDLIIGAPRSSANGDYSGSSYVVFGRGDKFFEDGFE